MAPEAHRRRRPLLHRDAGHLERYLDARPAHRLHRMALRRAPGHAPPRARPPGAARAHHGRDRLALHPPARHAARSPRPGATSPRSSPTSRGPSRAIAARPTKTSRPTRPQPRRRSSASNDTPATEISGHRAEHRSARPGSPPAARPRSASTCLSSGGRTRACARAAPGDRAPRRLAQDGVLRRLAVERIAEDRRPVVGEVNADLVRAPRLEAARTRASRAHRSARAAHVRHGALADLHLRREPMRSRGMPSVERVEGDRADAARRRSRCTRARSSAPRTAPSGARARADDARRPSARSCPCRGDARCRGELRSNRGGARRRLAARARLRFATPVAPRAARDGSRHRASTRSAARRPPRPRPADRRRRARAGHSRAYPSDDLARGERRARPACRATITASSM